MGSYKELSKRMEILPFLYSVFIFTSLYMVNNKNLFTNNLEVHNTRSANNFHLPITNLTKYQKGAHYAGIKIFNHLRTHVKGVANEIQIVKSALQRFLVFNLFYFIEEYFNSHK
jgi:hypothetical protein